MARILLGWELGAGRGHAVRLTRLARRLRAHGHRPILALQQVGALPEDVAEILQAPLWPGQIVTLARRAAGPPRGMGDILATLGLGDIAAMTGMLRAWDGLIGAVRPDAVAAEFAPGLMMAAHGRVPLLALGNGFSLPPANLDHFPALGADAPREPEEALRDRLNVARAACGRSPLASLPALFASDCALVSTFVELDPYRAWRPTGHGAPVTDGPVPAAGEGKEVFVYLSEPARLPAAFLDGLAASGLAVTLHVRALSPAEAAGLAATGFRIEPLPVPFARIVGEAGLLVSQGGLGFVSSALIAGLPQLILPFDMEKSLTAAAITGLGLGETVEAGRFDAQSFGATLRRLAGDSVLTKRARAAAPRFRARLARNAQDEAMAAIEELLRR
ncbi:glycosyltransferase [Flavisphingomonas formosensis]|uniref:glycosyltransferase n=1 Tax=Flavisphingomonas formosensis TaxID=861534 RepID=UPI0012F88837|nr:glycosyl transferase-like UDP-glucuronosyltransferase [Sphingomonas formosensis]